MTSVKTNKKGFTLVELVVVIAILAILAAIAIPVVNSIINTASKNGALSNAQTIELAVKECQADIAAKNTEVYNGQAKNSAAAKSVTIPNAKSGHDDITIFHVAVAKGIEDAFDQVTYNGENYYPWWDNDAGKCVFIDEKVSKTIDGSTTLPANKKQLSDGKNKGDGTTNGGKYFILNVKVQELKAATSTPATPATPAT